MNYKHTLHESMLQGIFDDGREIFIPTDPNNCDYQQYLAWVAEGNTAEPADPLPEPVLIVSALSAKLALAELNLLEPVLAYLDTLPRASQERIYWDGANTFERNHAMITQIGAAVGITAEQTDQAFTLAKAKDEPIA